MSFNDGQKMCTTTGEPVDKVRAEQTEKTGQHKAYIVLCEEERQKGFVRHAAPVAATLEGGLVLLEKAREAKEQSLIVRTGTA